MVVKYAKQESFGVAICQTFDGDHPCSLCHVVSKGKNSEKKSDLQILTPKIDMICPTRGFRLTTPFVRLDYALRDLFARQTGKSPPVPPPRFMLS